MKTRRKIIETKKARMATWIREKIEEQKWKKYSMVEKCIDKNFTSHEKQIPAYVVLDTIEENSGSTEFLEIESMILIFSMTENFMNVTVLMGRNRGNRRRNEE
uniref:Uncharacterized protein n=1 Tax=Romanomermis culicivorax TaxID=13658 RepID=A0A915I6A7_ROMCU